jgi:hypothetical protein
MTDKDIGSGQADNPPPGPGRWQVYILVAVLLSLANVPALFMIWLGLGQTISLAHSRFQF